MPDGFEERTPHPAEEQTASSRTKWILRRIPLLAFIVIVAAGLFVFYWQQPTELESEIRLDLIAKKAINETARVRVLDLTNLVTFHRQRFRIQFAIICIQEGSQLHLAQAECPRAGATWRSNSAEWLALDGWPTVEQREQYRKEQARNLLPSLMSGYLPRPADKADFQVDHLSIQVSAKSEGFDPNDGIDHALLAHLLKYEVEYTAKPHLNKFTFAPFHEPRWLDPDEGIAELHEYIEFLQRHGERIDVLPDRCDSMIETLQTAIQQLTSIRERGLKFHFLARQTKPD